MKSFFAAVLFICLSLPVVCQVSDTVKKNELTLTLYRLKDNSAQTIRLNRIVLLETDTLSYTGEPVWLEDSLLMFKASSLNKTKTDSIVKLDLNYIAGIGYCKEKTQDKYMHTFRRKGSLLSNVPAYVAGGIGVAGVFASIVDDNVFDFMGPSTNRAVTRIGAASLAFSITYTVFHYTFHRGKIKYYDINSKWSLTPVKLQ